MVFFVIFVIFVFFVPPPWRGSAQSPAVSGQGSGVRQPAANWAQFRGDARLSGATAADLPATLSLKWTYEAGETIESSAAIADGVVYAGAGNGDLLAIDLAHRQAALEVRDRQHAR